MKCLYDLFLLLLLRHIEIFLEKSFENKHFSFDAFSQTLILLNIYNKSNPLFAIASFRNSLIYNQSSIREKHRFCCAKSQVCVQSLLFQDVHQLQDYAKRNLGRFARLDLSVDKANAKRHCSFFCLTFHLFMINSYKI